MPPSKPKPSGFPVETFDTTPPKITDPSSPSSSSPSIQEQDNRPRPGGSESVEDGGIVDFTTYWEIFLW